MADRIMTYTISVDVMKARCDVLLIAMLGKNAALTWWDSRNKAFDMLTGKDQWDQDPTIVYNYLMRHASR